MRDLWDWEGRVTESALQWARRVCIQAMAGGLEKARAAGEWEELPVARSAAAAR